MTNIIQHVHRLWGKPQVTSPTPFDEYSSTPRCITTPSFSARLGCCNCLGTISFESVCKWKSPFHSWIWILMGLSSVRFQLSFPGGWYSGSRTWTRWTRFRQLNCHALAYTHMTYLYIHQPLFFHVNLGSCRAFQGDKRLASSGIIPWGDNSNRNHDKQILFDAAK